MAAVNVKKLLQEMIVPELQEIRMKVSTIEVEIKRLDEKVDMLKSDLRNLREEFRLAIDIHERLAAPEAKIGH